MDKQTISTTIKQIIEEQAINDFLRLCREKDRGLKQTSRLGTKTIDYFTFYERLNTKGRLGISFFEFLNEIETHIEKPYHRKMMNWLNEHRQNVEDVCKYYEIYRLYHGVIASFSPVNALQVYQRYNPKKILDFCSGWGGRFLGACVYGAEQYIGIDSNPNLIEPYNRMTSMIEQHTSTDARFIFGDCLKIDYSQLEYDMVFTSPPYFNLELYTGTNKKSNKEWNGFYQKVFLDTYKFLKPNGHYVLNIPKKVLMIAIDVLGEPIEQFNLGKPSRLKGGGEDYKEVCYVWRR